MRNTRRLEDKPLTEVYLHDSISLLRWKMFPKQSLKERFLLWKILPKAHYFPQFSICSPVMDAIVANDTFRSDKASQLQTSSNRHFVCCYNSRDASRDINQVPGVQKSSISLPGLVLKQNCHGQLSWESAGLLSGRSRVRILVGPTLRVLKITDEKVLSL